MYYIENLRNYIRTSKDVGPKANAEKKEEEKRKKHGKVFKNVANILMLRTQISLRTSTNNWHMGSRWYTSDFHVVTTDIKNLSHRGNMACIPA